MIYLSLTSLWPPTHIRVTNSKAVKEIDACILVGYKMCARTHTHVFCRHRLDLKAFKELPDGTTLEGDGLSFVRIFLK